MYEIHNDVPVPSNRPGPKPKTGYPFHAMEVGQCFFAPLTEKAKINSAVSRYGKRNGKRFCVVMDKGTDQVGCWRIE